MLNQTKNKNTSHVPHTNYLYSAIFNITLTQRYLNRGDYYFIIILLVVIMVELVHTLAYLLRADVDPTGHDL
jgi:hypothetical protein